MKNCVFKNKYFNSKIKILFTEEKHINDLLDYSLNKRFYKYLEYKVFDKYEAIKYFKKKINNKKIYFYSIVFKKKVIGTFSIHNINVKKKTCEIGYGINPKYWGKGIFKDLIKLTTTKIFKNGFNEIIVFTREDNYSSISGLIKNEFQIIKKLNNFYYDKKVKKYFNAIKLQCLKRKFYSN